MRRDEILVDDIRWLEIANAAQLCATSVVELKAMIEKGELASLVYESEIWLYRASVMRMKRENGLLRGAKAAKRNVGKSAPADISGSSGDTRVDYDQLKLPIDRGTPIADWKTAVPRK